MTKPRRRADPVHVGQLLPPLTESGKQTEGQSQAHLAQGSSTASASNERNVRRIGRVWERMTMIYGHKFTSNYGVKDDGTWEAALRSLSDEEIASGLGRLLQRQDEWPPGLPEFRSLCRPAAAPCHRFFTPSLPRPKADPEVVEKNLSKIRDALSGKSDA